MVRSPDAQRQRSELDTVDEDGNEDVQSDRAPVETEEVVDDPAGTDVVQRVDSPAPGFPEGSSQQLATRLLREEKAQSFVASVKNQFKPTMLLMTEQEILHFCINPHSAPPDFKEIYDTQKRFDWATSGFSAVMASFYPNGQKTDEHIKMICASMTLYDPSIVQRAQETLARFPQRDKVPASFFVAS